LDVNILKMPQKVDNSGAVKQDLIHEAGRTRCINCLCGKAGLESLFFALRLLRFLLYDHRRPGDASPGIHLLLRCCTPDSDWQNQACRASAQTLPSRQRKLLSETAWLFTMIPEKYPFIAAPESCGVDSFSYEKHLDGEDDSKEDSTDIATKCALSRPAQE
jgi:hypothetical protein